MQKIAHKFAAVALCLIISASFSSAADYAGSLNVYVKDSQGKSMAGVKVYAGDARNYAPKFNETTTNERGKATFRNLSPTTYIVQAKPEGYLRSIGKASVTTNGAAKVYWNLEYPAVSAAGTA
ncbi:MAG: carboxypeptidase regulatory-like domain-containing protein [Candidatus Diapherotrites archaeon]|uniref:Carboxypeptidase regulatory-like domain-containing protein n=1 Tax=Candidatus Iainarchaeum sp. TaxID=3101447 RepID=A0A8T3YIZ1_9ARCH|nr:carboxypeptidase regulatory-like domain-containing protein [Candidatus Diapherotrites archaeon]